MIVALENYKWLSKLKPFVSTDPARPALAAPWLDIKNDKMYICATNGHALVVVLLDAEPPQKTKNGFARLPIFEVGKSPQIDIDNVGATIKAEIRRNDGLPDPPKYADLIERVQTNREYTKFLVSPKLLAAGANLIKAIFPDKPGVEIMPATIRPKSQSDAMVMRAEDQQFQAIVMIMPVIL